MSPIIVGFSR